MQSPADGIISSAGVYTAPDMPGTYLVTATSVANGAVSATATVVVPGLITWGLATPRAGQTATLLPDGRILFAGGTVAPNSQASNSAELYVAASDQSSLSTAMTVARSGHTATLLPNGNVLIAGGANSAGVLQSAEIFNPTSNTFSATGNMILPRSGQTATLLPSGNVLIAGGLNCSSSCANNAELYSPSTGTFSSIGPLARSDQYQSATLLGSGNVLFALGVVNNLATTDAEVFNSATGKFAITGSLTTARQSATATLLPNGNVLFAGGLTSSGTVTATAEVYNSSAGSFSATGSLNVARDLHTATLLTNGEVLIAGGNSTTVRPSVAELYNPASGTFVKTGALGDPRIEHTATLLSNGTVVIAAGYDDQILGSTESYTPSSGIFSHHSLFMNISRANHTATVLQSGEILFAGGESLEGTTATAELFNPVAMTFTLTGSMTVPREGHTATLLPSGQVLIVGGSNDASGSGTIPLATAEIYNPTSGTFTATASPNVARLDHTATLLVNGKVLIAGGVVPGYPPPPNNLAYSSAEIYDPTAGTFTLTQSMTTPRFDQTATLFSDGQVFIAGGVDEPSFSTTGAPAELYNPSTSTFTAVTASASSLEPDPVYPIASALLLTGQVLAGTSVLYDPPTNKFISVNTSGLPTTVSASGGYSFALLPNGQVLVSGSMQSASASPTAWSLYIFDPRSLAYSPAGTLRHARSTPTEILLPDNLVLIAGGNDSLVPSDVLEAELYQAPAATSIATLTSVSPTSLSGFSSVDLVVNGTNFVSGSAIQVDGTSIPTTLVSNTQLDAPFPVQSLLVAGNHTVTVANANGVVTAPLTITVTNPQLQPPDPSGTTLSFGSATVGALNAQLLAFANVGNAPLTLDSVALTGTNSADFVLDPVNSTCPLSSGAIAPSTTCLIAVDFAPQAIHSSTVTLTMVYGTPSSHYTLALTGTGTGTPALSITPPSLSFGSQSVGSSSPGQPLVITNLGTSILSINSMSSGDPTDFPSTNNCGSSLAAGVSCTVTFSFTPSATGNFLASFTLTSSDPGSPHVVQLSGTGIAASQSSVTINPTSLAFGTQVLGGSSAAQTITISDSGSTSLTGITLTLTDSIDFSVTRNCPTTLTAGVPCIANITFTPSAAGSISGSGSLPAARRVLRITFHSQERESIRPLRPLRIRVEMSPSLQARRLRTN